MKKCTVVAGALLLVAASLFAGGNKDSGKQVLKVAGLKGPTVMSIGRRLKRALKLRTLEWRFS